jgi:hypothetical protein
MTTAAELSKELVDVPVGHGAQLVREVLRSFDCFVEPYRGHWQVAHTVGLTGLEHK